jgi:predicted HTH transcriptional regulator
MIDIVAKTLKKLAELIQQQTFVELETDGLEIKSVPASGSEWHEHHKSINAFLNTRGGIVILGIKEEGQGKDRRYVFTGWKEYAESNLKQIPRQFTDRKGAAQDLSDCFPPPELIEFAGGRVAVVYVDELAADRRYVFYNGMAYKRILTGDHKISETEIDAQEEFKEEAVHARELQPVPQMSEADIDLEKLNHFIFHLNQFGLVETLKSDLQQAHSFLHRRCFLQDGVVTVLGALVCGRHPGDHLGFRCHVHGYVDLPQQVAQDKQDYIDNVLPLMESSLGYILRNIHVGVGIEHGGTSRPQYPESLLRETVNNALAHRDYSINKQVIITIKPGSQISIRNPGAFRPHLLIEAANVNVPIRRILPEAKPRNPKLADVLRVYRKWEGRAIGMATLVNLCLQNEIDLPYYRLYHEEVCLHLCAGKLFDERMERLFQSFDRYVEARLDGNSPTEEQKLVLSYVIKSEWANRTLHYTILLTPDNNHFEALLGLERAGLIEKHSASTAMYPVYVADRALVRADYFPELRGLFGTAFDELDQTSKQILGVVYRFNEYSKSKDVSAKQTSFSLWYETDQATDDIRRFDAFYRNIRSRFNKLTKSGFLEKTAGSRGYVLRRDFLETHLL